MSNTRVVDNIIQEYVKNEQMFTVYQIWQEANVKLSNLLSFTGVGYTEVRDYVENLIDDNHSKIKGWTRSIGNHLVGLNNQHGRVGQAPQIYHPVKADPTKYDMNYRLPLSRTTGRLGKSNSPKPNSKKAFVPSKKKYGGIFRFFVWKDGKQVPCLLVQKRDSRGIFTQNEEWEACGVLDNGESVIVKQDEEGKLYV